MEWPSDLPGNFQEVNISLWDIEFFSELQASVRLYYEFTEGNLRTLRSIRNSSYFLRTRFIDLAPSSRIEFKNSTNLRGAQLVPGARLEPKGGWHLLSRSRPNSPSPQVIHCFNVQTIRVKSQFRHALHEKTSLQCEHCESLVIKYVRAVEVTVQLTESITGEMARMEILSSRSRKFSSILRTIVGILEGYVRPSSNVVPYESIPQAWDRGEGTIDFHNHFLQK